MTIKIAIIGSGPSAFYSAQSILKLNQDCEIDILDKLFSPFGLVRYGVAPDHQKTKNVIRVFDRILYQEQVQFFGCIDVGKTISIEKLKSFYDAIIIATGMAIDRPLSIKGDNKLGCYGAAEFVGWYNGHPDHKDLNPQLDNDTAVIIGNGNVAIDCARVLAKNNKEMEESDITEYSAKTIIESPIKKIYIIGRRGPLDAKFTTVEIREMGELLDCNSVLSNGTLSQIPLSKNLEKIEKQYKILTSFSELDSLDESERKPKTVEFRFYAKPIEILGDEKVNGIRFEINHLNDKNIVEGTGKTFEINTGLIISAIGYYGEKIDGIPFDEKSGKIINNNNIIDDNLYAAGWIARGPTGVIGTNKHDGDRVAKNIVDKITPNNKAGRSGLQNYLSENNFHYINKVKWKIINEEEVRRASNNSPRKKFIDSNEVYKFLNN